MKNYIKIIVAFALVLCVVASTGAMFGVFADPLDGITVSNGSQNLLSNGGFEYCDSVAAIETVDKNTYLTNGWNVGSATNTAFALNDDAKSGKKSLSATLSAGANFSLRSDNADSNGIISGLESGVYSLSLYAKGSGNIVIKYKDAAFKNVTEKPLALTPEWQKLSVDVMVVGVSGKIQFEISSAGDSGTVFIDDVYFAKYTGLQNGDFENSTGYTVPEALYDFGCNTNYNYINDGNLLTNAGFEDSTTVTNTSGKGWDDAIITKGWTSSFTHKKFVYSITDDTHSGRYSLRVDIGAADQDNNDTRLHANIDIITDTALKGRIIGLDANSTYIVSYWVKGSGKTQVFWKSLNATGSAGDNVRDGMKQYDDWTLVTDEVSTNALGQAWWNINIGCLNDVASYVIIDDVSMLTKAQAIANTEAMIDAFNPKSAYALQAKSDIEKWVEVLGKTNISNYSKFDEIINGKSDSDAGSSPEQDNEKDEYTYLSLNNVLNNSGFENSDSAINTSGSWKSFTDDWMTSDEIKSANTSLEISNDAHSGKNALMISGIKDKEYRIFNSKANASNSTLAGITEGLNANTTYLVSYWVKGNATSRVYAKSYSSNAWSNDWGDKLENPGNNWKLYTKEVKTNAAGEAWYNVYLYMNADTEIYLDDIVCQTKAQAISNVVEMINVLDTDKPYSKRAIDDIEQWVAALGSANISNYDLFVAKKSINANNILDNSGFEKTDIVTNTSDKAWDLAVITEGWTTHYSKSSKFNYSISNDAHSGNNSLKLSMPAGTDDTRIFANKNLITDTELKGRMSGLTADQTYIVSYWVKGSGKTRIFWKTLSSAGASVSNKRDELKQYDDWTLVTDEVTSYAVGTDGQAWWNINVYRTDGITTEVYIDDVMMQTKAHAIANVEAMITAFNPSDANAIKKAVDIEQWINALGKENISNYDAFVEKSSQILNMDFELSDSASLKKGDYTNFTTGWKTNYVNNNPPYSVDIVKDAFSGNNSLKVNVNKADADSGFRAMIATANGNKNDSIYDGLLSGYTPNTDYIVSYWVKGTADTKVFGKTNNGSSWGNNWQKPAHTATSNVWSLNGHTVKTDASGNAWWTLFVVGDVADTYAIIDDVSFVPKSDAIANVEAMINVFDYKKATEDDIYIIDQWMKVVTVSDDAKNSYKDKLADYEALQAELAWKAIDGVYGWEANVDGKITTDNTSVAYGDKALKVNAQEAVSLRPTQVPFGMQNGYYMLVLYVKGGGKINITANADNGLDQYELLNKTLNIPNNWDKITISNISIKENYSISDLRLNFSDSSNIYLDAVQMYRQIGPGSSLDDITNNVFDNKLILGATPDGYFTEVYKTSNSDVLSKTGEITVPKFDTDIEYRFKIVNINDSTDYAISDLRFITVNGTDGIEPVEKGEKKVSRTITDEKTKVSVTALMSEDALLTVKVLDSSSKYYDLLLNYNHECIAHYNIFTIPQTAYEGDRTFTFTVDEVYNGKTLIVTRYDKETRAFEEYEIKVVDGKISLTTPNDGVFMIQKVIEKTTTSQDSTVEKPDELSKDDTSKDNDSNKDKENTNKDNFSKPNKQVIVKQKSNAKLIWTIIFIGLGLLLLMLIFIIVIIILRKRNEEETQSEVSYEKTE